MSESVAIIEAIQAAQRAQGVAGVQPVTALQNTADPAAVEKFQAVMAAPPVQGVPLTDQIAAVWKTSQVEHQGLLHRIKALGEYSRQNGPTLAELSELQYDIATLSFQQDVVTNVAKKASDGVQTLIKNG